MTDAQMIAAIKKAEGWPKFTDRKDDLSTRSWGPPRNSSTRRLVLRLLQWSRPATVGRFVVAVIVLSVNRMLLGWPSAHIRQKGAEVFPPSVANGDAAASVVNVLFIRRCVASALHVKPRLVLGRFDESGRFAMCGGPLSNLFGAQAAAAIGSLAELFGNNQYCRAAFTTAQPSHAATKVLALFQHGKSSEHHPDHFYFSHGARIPHYV